MIEIATFLTVGGAPLVMYKNEMNSDPIRSICHGCAEGKTYPVGLNARSHINEHAATCRAVPRH